MNLKPNKTIRRMFKMPKAPSVNVNPINAKYASLRAEGYLTDADKAQVEMTNLLGQRTASRTAEVGRARARDAARARGLSGASAAALETSVGQQEARDRSSAAMAAANESYGLYSGNRDFERQKQMTAWGNEIGAATTNAQLKMQRQAEFWNSITGLAGDLAGAFATGGASLAMKPVAGVGQKNSAMTAIKGWMF